MRRSESITYRWFQGESGERVRDVVWCPYKILHTVNVQSEHVGLYFVEETLSNGHVLRSTPVYLIINSTNITEQFKINSFCLIAY